jgi:hypothetical protein
MAQLKIKDGIYHIIKIIKSNIDSIKQRLIYLLTSGGKEGVLFFNEKNKNISAEQWFAIILEKVKYCKVDDIDIRHEEKTYIQIPEYKKRIEIIERQYPLVIKFARENGWNEGESLTVKQVAYLEKKVKNELSLSSIK